MRVQKSNSLTNQQATASLVVQQLRSTFQDSIFFHFLRLFQLFPFLSISQSNHSIHIFVSSQGSYVTIHMNKGHFTCHYTCVQHLVHSSVLTKCTHIRVPPSSVFGITVSPSTLTVHLAQVGYTKTKLSACGCRVTLPYPFCQIFRSLQIR